MENENILPKTVNATNTISKMFILYNWRILPPRKLAKINPIVAERDSNWIAQYGTDYNSVAECVTKAAGEVRTTANTLKKIIQEMLREDTAQ